MNQFTCPSCDWVGHPSFELNDKGKLVAQCGRDTCGYSDPSVTPAHFNEGHVKSSTGVITKVDTQPVAAPPRPSSVQPPPAAPQPAAPPAWQAYPPAMQAPGDVLGWIRSRLDYLSAEIARLDALKIEQKALSKMLGVGRRRRKRRAAKRSDGV